MKIIVVSGFLGAGKTEFIKELSKNTNKKFVILENEFGEENLDSEYLKKELGNNADMKVWELTQGCICCSVNLDLAHSILTIANTLNPDYLVIEPSGVARVSNLIEKLRKISYERIELGVPILILDAYNYRKNLENNAEYIEDSLKHSGLVVLSKSEQLEVDDFLRIKKELGIMKSIKFPEKHYKKWSKDYWEDIFNTNVIIEKKEEQLSLRFSVEKRGIDNFEQLTLKKISLRNVEQLEIILLYLMSKRLGEIDRVKGYLKIKEANYKFDLVGELYIIEGCENIEENKVVIIGKKLEKETLKEIFNSN